MNDRKRIDFLAKLFANCPTAKVKYKPGDDEDPLYTIAVLDVCAPAMATGKTFRAAVDAMIRRTSQPD